jgi:glycosyltransferase involved in cell wall biosynthesis
MTHWARPVPIFVISYNRADALRCVLASYRRQSECTEIVVHDNGSDDPATLAYLDELAKEGVRVYMRQPIRSADELNSVNESVSDYFEDWAEPSNYIVTDCDIDLGIANANALAIYAELLDRFREAECVGPMLRISDISRKYFLFNHVMNRHIEQFWHRDPIFTSTSKGEVAYIEALIDTTFALHRAGEPFRRLKQGLRVYFPYEARHLDWYLEERMAGGYNDSSSANISHWNNRTYYESKCREALLFEEYKVVEQDGDGRLKLRLMAPADDNPE